MRRTAQPRNVATRQPIVKKPVKVVVPRKAGRVPRKWNGDSTLDLSGTISVTDSLKIQNESITIGTVENGNEKNEGNQQQIQAHFVSNSVTIENNPESAALIFDTIDESNSSDHRIMYNGTPVVGTILATVGEASSAGKYVLVSGPTATDIEGYYFQFASVTDGVATLTGTAEKYDASYTTNDHAQYYFKFAEAGLVRIDKYTEDGTTTYVKVKQVAKTEGEGYDITATIVTKVEGVWTDDETYTGELLYPFRPSDAYTEELETPAIVPTTEDVYTYNNDIVFDFGSENNVPEIKESIKTSKSVIIKKDADFDHAIEGTVERYNDADYLVKNTDGEGYKEVAANVWIIDKEITFTIDGTSTGSKANITYSADKQNMRSYESGESSLYFGEGEVIVKNGKYVEANPEASEYGHLICEVLTLTGCPKITVEGKVADNDEKNHDGVIECTQLVI